MTYKLSAFITKRDYQDYAKSEEWNESLVASVFEVDKDMYEFSVFSETKVDLESYMRMIPKNLFKDMQLEELPETNWVAENQKSFKPIRAGEFYLHPSFYEGEKPKDAYTIEMDAGMAFGSGEHETTKGCLLLLSEVKEAPGSILDMGTGSGILSIAAMKKFPNTHLIAADIDKDSVDSAKRNFETNGINDNYLFECILSDGFGHESFRDSKSFDLIMANILLAPLLEMSSEMNDRLSTDGILILSGILNTQLGELKEKYLQLGLTVEKEHSENEWAAIILRKKK